MNPLTPSGWLNLYMQIHTDARNLALQGIHGDVNTEFFYPRYSGYKFIKASQIIDLFSLDPGFLRYSYSTIAAAAVYFVYDKNVALTVSGRCCCTIMLYVVNGYRLRVDLGTTKRLCGVHGSVLQNYPGFGRPKAGIGKLLRRRCRRRSDARCAQLRHLEGRDTHH